MRIAHRSAVNSWFTVPESDPVDEGYQAEVDRSTGRAERCHQRAQDRLMRAEQRLAVAQARKTRTAHQKRIRQLRGLVEERRAERAEIERLMMPPVAADKQLMLRTGREDHLEPGIPMR